MLGAYCLAAMCFLIKHSLCKETVRLLCTPPTTVRLEDTTSVIDSPTNAKAYLQTHSTSTYSVSVCAFKSLASLIGCHWLLQMNWQPHCYGQMCMSDRDAAA